MNQIFRISLVFLAAFLIFLSYPAQAANQETPPTAKLTVNVNIDQSNIFWNYTFLTKDGDLGKPAAIKLIWSRGDSPSKEKTETILIPGKSSGNTTIVTDKGSIVNLRVCVYDVKNNKLGYIDLQVQNKGQSETINITPPEFTQPTMTWGNY